MKKSATADSHQWIGDSLDKFEINAIIHAPAVETDKYRIHKAFEAPRWRHSRM